MFYIMIIKQVTNDEGENIEWNGQIIEYKNIYLIYYCSISKLN